MSDIVMVRMATARASEEGTEFTFSTVEGVEIKFLLDDLAISILGVTMSAVTADMKARLTPVPGQTKQPVRIFEKEGEGNNG